jgi:hypothetical protein
MSDCPQQHGTGHGAQCGHLQALLAEVVVALERGEGERLSRTIDHVNGCGAMAEVLAKERAYRPAMGLSRPAQ